MSEHRKYQFILWIMSGISIAAFVMGMSGALAHEAHTASGYPLGWKYDPGCCRSAEEPGGDCAPIASEYVTEGPDGYHINLPRGAHPKLINSGYSGVVPYGKEKASPEGNYHICLSTDGATRYCFYAGARGF